MFRSAPYDVIVTDLIMPNGEGIETIMVLRKEFSSVGVVAMSGGSTHSPVYLRMARQLGAHVALEKPFTVGELVEAVENVRTLGVC
jgi:DNA-binding NarL/FixJ family response regulator